MLILAHGAGAPMDSPFMEDMAKRLAVHSIETLRFEFPYMAARRLSGGKRPPDRLPKLCDHYWQVIEKEAQRTVLPIFTGGKSMGGRIAVMTSQHVRIKGVVCLGYPFHPVGKPETLRTDVLAATQKPVLIAQGTRDKLGNREEVTGYGLKNSIIVEWLDDGDHDLKPRKKSGWTHDQHMQAAADSIARFIIAVG